MSIAGGMPTAVERALRVDASALQVFCKSSNRWDARPFAPGEVEAFRTASERAGLDRYTLSHCSYLLNLASPDDALWERSIEGLRVELERCEQLGIPYVVLHPGSHVGTGVEAGLRRVAAGLDRILAPPRRRRPAFPGQRLLLETTAGQGSNLGSSFEELAWILEHARCGPRLGVCFDTCHVLAAGYDFRTARSYREMFAALDAAVGLDRVHAFHLNDSRTDLGSRKDRHEHIGAGFVGDDGFRRLLRDARFRGRPMVLETPKGDDLAEDRANLARLRDLAAPVRS